MQLAEIPATAMVYLVGGYKLTPDQAGLDSGRWSL